MGGPCDYCVSPSPFGLDFGTLDFGTSDLDLTKKEEKGHMKPFSLLCSPIVPHALLCLLDFH